MTGKGSQSDQPAHRGFVGPTYHIAGNLMSGLIMYCKENQGKTHVQTAPEPHDLNMDFNSFYNDVKQLCS